MEGGRDGGREGGRDGRREGGTEGGRKGRREGRREGGKTEHWELQVIHTPLLFPPPSSPLKDLSNASPMSSLVSSLSKSLQLSSNA